MMPTSRLAASTTVPGGAASWPTGASRGPSAPSRRASQLRTPPITRPQSSIAGTSLTRAARPGDNVLERRTLPDGSPRGRHEMANRDAGSPPLASPLSGSPAAPHSKCPVSYGRPAGYRRTNDPPGAEGSPGLPRVVSGTEAPWSAIALHSSRWLGRRCTIPSAGSGGG